MSWIKSAFNKAAEAAGGAGKGSVPSSLSRVRLYAGSVVQNAGHAVAGSAKIFQERLSGKHYNNFKHAVRRLDEVSLATRGGERLQALTRWLGALKDLDNDAKVAASKLERQSAASREGSPGSPTDQEPVAKESNEVEAEEELPPTPSKAASVLFFDSEVCSEPLSFRDLFLRSNALENIVTSLILDAPEDEEVSIVLEMFQLCLAGGQEVHKAIMSGIQDLSKVNTGYSDEVLITREELLHMARDVVTGLKQNSAIERLNAEIGRLQQHMDEKLASLPNEAIPLAFSTESEDLPDTLKEGSALTEEILHLASRLGDCLQKKKAELHQGDDAETRNEKVDRLKQLATELADGAAKIKAKVSESRQQKSDAMAYRVTKSQEVSEVEKVATAEIESFNPHVNLYEVADVMIIADEMQTLEKRRAELEAELVAVTAAIAQATKRHVNIQEEKEQFDEASSNIVAHLTIQEEDGSRSMAAHTTEVNVLKMWQDFLEDTWKLQQSCIKEKEQETMAAIDCSRIRFFQIAASHLRYRQEELSQLLIKLKARHAQLDDLQVKREELQASGQEPGIVDVTSNRRRVEEKYVDLEGQLKRALASLKKIKADVETYSASEPQESSVKELQHQVVEALAKADALCADFEGLPRPALQIEQPVVRVKKHFIKSSESWGGVSSRPDPPSMQRDTAGAAIGKDGAAAGATEGTAVVEDSGLPQAADSEQQSLPRDSAGEGPAEDAQAALGGAGQNEDGWELDDADDRASTATHGSDRVRSALDSMPSADQNEVTDGDETAKGSSSFVQSDGHVGKGSRAPVKPPQR
eukprot:SM000060S19697  [mRNA]  locus=s60:623982:629254:- [translate_table: standard]